MNHSVTPSASALMSAAARAAHLIVDGGRPILVDDQARALATAASVPGLAPLDHHLATPSAWVLAAARLATVARSRFAEDVLAASGLDQHVVLGAGLDTSAHRAAPGARTWLVDRPGVLAWRRKTFAAAGVVDVGEPVAADLVTEHVLPALTRHGLRRERPAAFSWLGTTMYLGPTQVVAVLARLAGAAPGSLLVLDHVLPPAERDQAGRDYGAAIAGAVGASGEPWRSSFAADELTALLADAGWRVRRSVAQDDAVPAGSAVRGALPQRLVRLVEAERTSAP